MMTEKPLKGIQEWFYEFDEHLLSEDAPSAYFKSLIDQGSFPDEYPFSLILELKAIPQQKQHHPEGSVFNHVMQVIDIAATFKNESLDPRAFMWAALLHDLGKIPTTKLRKGKIISYDHDIEGEKLTRDFLRRCTVDENFISHVCALVRWHMQVLFVVNGLPFADLHAMLRSVDPKEIALLVFCDRLGRGTKTSEEVEAERKKIQLFLSHCHKVKNS